MSQDPMVRDSAERIAELLEANNQYLQRARDAEARALKAEAGNLSLVIEVSELSFFRDLWKSHYKKQRAVLLKVREDLALSNYGEGPQHNMPIILQEIDAALEKAVPFDGGKQP